MKTIFKSIALASLGLAMLLSCTKNETIDVTPGGDRLMELSVTGVLGEYKAVEGTKATLVNTPRVGWSGNETVHVFQQSDGTYLGSLTSNVKSTGASVATLSGSITSGTGKLVFVYTNATMPSLTVGTAYTSLEVSLATQGADTPFVVYGTADSPGTETVSGLVVNFSFATSVVSTYAAGLPASKAVTKAELSSINTNCVLTIPTSGDITVSGNTSGTISKTEGIGNTNAQGQVLFEIAVPVSEAVSSSPGRIIEFTTGTETYTTAFSNVAIESGKAYSAMSENHSIEGVVLNKTSITISPNATETLTATVYPEKSTQTVTWTSSNETIATVNETGIVTGIAPGTATITATTADGGKTATCTVTVEDLDYVEMKMGSDQSKTLKWKKMNLGATTVAGSGETCYGDYYAWGETRPYYETKTWDDTYKKWNFVIWYPYKPNGYEWESYCNGSTTFSEWDPAPYDGTTKNLKPEYDVVQQKVGNGWRMPTSAEFQALYEACGGNGEDCTPLSGGSSSTTAKGIYWCDNFDGVAGCLFCDGTNRLFFPAAGSGSGTSLSGAGSNGRYWSSSLYSSPNSAYLLYFDSSNVYPQDDSNRYFGRSVRPVSD